MSGDLISRSALKEFLVKARNKAGEEKIKAIMQENKEGFVCADSMLSAFEIALRVLSTQPTAYDVDKVVEKLQEYQSNFPVDSQNDYFRGVGIGAKSCIEIVKAGGVE